MENDQELYGVVQFYGAESRQGIVEADGVRYGFSETDVVKGIPQQGAYARFRAGEVLHAVNVEIA